jgi:hypothetical protein
VQSIRARITWLWIGHAAFAGEKALVATSGGPLTAEAGTAGEEDGGLGFQRAAML